METTLNRQGRVVQSWVRLVRNLNTDLKDKKKQIQFNSFCLQYDDWIKCCRSVHRAKSSRPLIEIPVEKTEISGTEPARPPSNNFTKDLEVRRDLGNRAHVQRPLGR